MKKKILFCTLIFSLVLSWILVSAQDGFYVISTKKQNYAPVPKTGQTTSYATGDDGDLELGVTSPNPRFTDKGDGTVMDNLTGLIWLKNAGCLNAKPWSDAITLADSLHDGWTGDGSGGDCGLSDSSSAGDWRLPNIRELHSLIDFSNATPAIPTGHPFTGVQVGFHWSSTTDTDFTDRAWYMKMHNGAVISDDKGYALSVWPVRGGN